METKLEQLGCGQCGCYYHKLYKRTNGEIVVECRDCKSTSEIVVTQPVINIRNNSGLGTLCVYD